MCRGSTRDIIFLCGDKEDGPCQLTPVPGCNWCGIKEPGPITKLGPTRRRRACDDCIANGKWVQVDGAWKPKAEVDASKS